MTAVTSQSLDRDQNTSVAAARTPERCVLTVIDGSERSGRLVEQIKVLAGGARSSIKVVLLNVQPAPAEGRLRGFGSFKRDEIVAGLTNAGRRAVTAAGRVLSHIGIEHRDRVEIGEIVETILRVATEEGCDLILIGSPSPGSLQKWIQGATGVWISTTAGQVAQLAAVPVVIVK